MNKHTQGGMVYIRAAVSAFQIALTAQGCPPPKKSKDKVSMESISHLECTEFLEPECSP